MNSHLCIIGVSVQNSSVFRRIGIVGGASVHTPIGLLRKRAATLAADLAAEMAHGWLPGDLIRCWDGK